MPPFVLHPNCILRDGLIGANINQAIQERRNLAANVAQLKSFCGRHPRHLARALRDLQVAGIMSEDEAKPRESLDGFLLANNFLKCCETNNARFAGSSFTECNKNKLIVMTWKFVDHLAILKAWKITCPAT